MKCVSCGADVDLGETKCHYCGTVAPADDSRSNDRKVVFARIKKSPEFAVEQLRRTMDQLPGVGCALPAVGIGFLVLWTCATFGMAMMAASQGAPGFFSLVPGGMGCLGLAALIGMVAKFVRISSAEPVARPAIVIGKRTEVRGGGENSRASTSYFATFEYETGRREELSVERKVYGEIAEEDAGILFTKAEYVAKFVRVL